MTKCDITIRYAKSPSRPSSSPSVHVAYINYALDTSSTALFTKATTWVAALQDRAYGESQRQKRLKVLINPRSGTGKAPKLYTREIEPILAAARCTIDVERTAYSGHAVEICRDIDIDAFDAIVCCGGDGVVHEAFNGLAQKPNAIEALRKVAVVQLPCGSGNAMSWNLNGTGDCALATLAAVKGVRTLLDLASVTYGDKRTISFLSQAIGIVADSDLGTDHLRWMGAARFTFGFFTRLLGKTVYPCDVAVKYEIVDKQEIKQHYAREIAKRRKIALDGSSRAAAPHAEPSSSSSDPTQGLPPLRYGTVHSPLPGPGATPPSPSGAGWTELSAYHNLGNFYSGNMSYMAESAPFFPASLPNDGLLDLVTMDGDIGRIKAVASLLAVEKNTFFDLPYVHATKVSAFRVVPRFGRYSAAAAAESEESESEPELESSPATAAEVSREQDDAILVDADGQPNSSTRSSKKKKTATRHLSGPGRHPRRPGKTAASGSRPGSRSGGGGGGGGFISIDGEQIPFGPFQVEVHRGLGTVLSRRAGAYESPGPLGWERISSLS